jgi:hypothetical protein
MAIANLKTKNRKTATLFQGLKCVSVWHSFDNKMTSPYNALTGATGSWRMFLQEGFGIGRAAIHRVVVCPRGAGYFTEGRRQADDQEIIAMGGSLRLCDHRCFQILALNNYGTCPNPAKMRIDALTLRELRSACSAFSSQQFNYPLLVRECLAMSLPGLFWGGSAIIKETHMALDKIIVFIMAIAFFGGLIFLALKGRRDTTRDSQQSSSHYQDAADDVALPIQPQGKERRKSKN